MPNKKIDPNLIASMIGDEPTQFNHLQCTLVKYSDSIDELAEAVVYRDMVGVVHILSEDIDTLINEGPLDWVKKKLRKATSGWDEKNEADEVADEVSDETEDDAAASEHGDSESVADAMSSADTQGKYGHHPETSATQTEWEEKYSKVYSWTVDLLKRLNDPEKGALGRKPKWMMHDPDMQKLLKALANELYHRSKSLKPTYYSKGSKKPGKDGRPGRSINKQYDNDIV